MIADAFRKYFQKHLKRKWFFNDIINGEFELLRNRIRFTVISYQYVNGIRIFGYPKRAEPLREQIRVNTERLAQDNGVEIEFIRRNNFRKEKRIKEIIAKLGVILCDGTQTLKTAAMKKCIYRLIRIYGGI